MPNSCRSEHCTAVVCCPDGHNCYVQASLLVGGAGTAKTSIINLFLSRFNPEEASSKTITFSYLTTPQIFQMSVEVCCTQCLLNKPPPNACCCCCLCHVSVLLCRKQDLAQNCPRRLLSAHAIINVAIFTLCSCRNSKLTLLVSGSGSA